MTGKAPAQITGHISSEERDAFKSYALTFSLDPASLLALLLERELRLMRLDSLMEDDVPCAEAASTKVTVHGRRPAWRRRVVEAATSQQTSVSNFCAVVIRAELRNRWLERVLTTRFESL